ncbi:hypothetical protein N8I77_005374 [Diaporthe amygdali]|uniref:Uncharacterized protein n=1 Tax=Phomopsis amygdali TaxID=1214568 RepID=A0AAD9W5J2_PHOAM|nr:hypothetical protein N8I77_005374 [Diaporthe amygdali]
MKHDSSTLQGSAYPVHRSNQQEAPLRGHELHSPPPPPYTSTADDSTSPFVSKNHPSIKNTTSLPTEGGSSSGAYTREPAMSAEPTSPDPWAKYDDVPGCCCSTTGGCCFSSRGGCCFSDTEGCCFSSTKGCCFSSDSACCFSNQGNAVFSFGKSRSR